MTYTSLIQEGSIFGRGLVTFLPRCLRRLVRSPYFTKWYPIITPGILLATVLCWSTLGARVQLENADTLADSYLFKDGATFHGGTFPGQHTQLLKWPLFFLIKLLGFSSASFIAVTVLLVILTVAALVLVIYCIERRPLVRGTICLVLASILLLIPVRPYAAGLLPVNMAMLTTRNIEYIFYLAALILLARTKHLKDWSFWLATACLTLLIASDELFQTIGLSASLLALIVYAIVQRWKFVVVAVHWLSAQIVASLAALALVSFMTKSHLTHITNTSGAGPYGLVTNFHHLIVGSLYAGLEVLTNVGANPAFDSMTLKDVPHVALTRVFSVGGLAFGANLLVASLCAYAVVWLVRRSLRPSQAIGKASIAVNVSLMLIWTSIAAVVSFAASNHDYAVDARYLTIVLFTALIAGVTVNRYRQWSTGQLVGTGFVFLIVSILGLITTVRMSNGEQAALAVIDHRDAKIAAALKQHPTNLLVGDYWRILPIEQKVGTLRVMPLAKCTMPRPDLTSSTWQADLSHTSFAYLLSRDQKLTDYPSCSIQQVVQAYGRPNTSVLIAGTADTPEEQLLFYDRGAHHSSPVTPQPTNGPSTVVPIALDELPYTSCPAPTIMAVVAHQDDDLLFMNPDILHAIKADYCVRMVYVTAGDGGFGEYYWLKRQLGSEAAYATLLGTNQVWIERIVKLAPNEFVTVANPRGNSKVSLIFMHLPDGNLLGQGFKYSHYESLAKLLSHRIPTLHGVDGQSTYTLTQLVAALNSLMLTYSPTEIYTQSGYIASPYPDHSDHMAAGAFTTLAHAKYEKVQFDNIVNIPIRFYVGYPIHGLPVNVEEADLKLKTAIFLSYAHYDNSVCNSLASCKASSTYGSYLNRQYTNSR